MSSVSSRIFLLGKSNRVACLAWLTVVAVGLGFPAGASATPKRVLFIGNSFTVRDGVDVPAAVRGCAAAGGFETPVTDYNCPGSYTLSGHYDDTTTRAKIALGGWDYVVLQEQSTTPTLAATDVYDYSYWFFVDVYCLYDLVKASNPNATIVLYETWAWKESRIISENNPLWGTNEVTMQNRISLAYHNVADQLIASGRTNVIIAHAGDAREVNRINQNLNMFMDDSHPNYIGVYLSGLTIYSAIFNASPLGNSYSGGLSAGDLAYVQTVVSRSSAKLQPPPVRVSAEAGTNQVSLSWPSVPGATSYRVKRVTSANGSYATLATVTATNYVNTNLNSYNTLFYAVSSVSSAGEGPNSPATQVFSPALPGNPLWGDTIGTPGSYNDLGDEIYYVFDNNVFTYFDGPVANGCWAGYDFGAGVSNVIKQIRYAPRILNSSRMTGGVFQAANNTNFTGAVTLATVTSTPPEGALTVLLINNPNAFRCVRYLAPNNSWGNVAEVQFLGGSYVSTAPVTLNPVIASNQLVFSWPANHIGWRLEMQANSFGVGLGTNTNWITVAGSDSTNQVSMPIAATNGSAFFRLKYP
jgi:hypothetical protein